MTLWTLMFDWPIPLSYHLGIASGMLHHVPPCFFLMLSSPSVYHILSHVIFALTEKKGVRILPFYLPTQSPWLNPIEPKWVHGKRNVVVGNGLLTANQLIERVSAYYRSPLEPHLVIPEKVA